MAFIKRNDGFVCQNCGHQNPPAPKTCRNHCRHCLHSLHVDCQSPGDRKSECHGLMLPMAIEGDIDNLIIHHRCSVCGKEIKNKVAEDDNLEEVMKICAKMET